MCECIPSEASFCILVRILSLGRLVRMSWSVGPKLWPLLTGNGWLDPAALSCLVSEELPVAGLLLLCRQFLQDHAEFPNLYNSVLVRRPCCQTHRSRAKSEYHHAEDVCRIGRCIGLALQRCPAEAVRNLLLPCSTEEA